MTRADFILWFCIVCIVIGTIATGLFIYNDHPTLGMCASAVVGANIIAAYVAAYYVDNREFVPMNVIRTSSDP